LCSFSAYKSENVSTRPEAKIKHFFSNMLFSYFGYFRHTGEVCAVHYFGGLNESRGSEN
jgi:hypothetical protein